MKLFAALLLFVLAVVAVNADVDSNKDHATTGLAIGGEMPNAQLSTRKLMMTAGASRVLLGTQKVQKAESTQATQKTTNGYYGYGGHHGGYGGGYGGYGHHGGHHHHHHHGWGRK